MINEFCRFTLHWVMIMIKVEKTTYKTFKLCVMTDYEYFEYNITYNLLFDVENKVTLLEISIFDMKFECKIRDCGLVYATMFIR